MSADINTRVTALEFRADATEKELGSLKQTGDTLKKSLESMQRSLDQIKYLAIGAVGAFVAQQFGLMKALKVVFGIG